MPLRNLYCSYSQVSDLSPLQGCKSLTALYINNTKVTPAQVAALQKALPNCKIEWDDPAKAATPQPSASSKLFMHDPAFPQWMKDVQAMPAEEQIEAVSKKLMELNPGFDGKLTGYDAKAAGYNSKSAAAIGPPRIESGAVIELGLVSDNLTDISPVRVFSGLVALSCKDSGGYRGRVTDLSPLAGLRLQRLTIGGNKCEDLSPLQGMPLVELNCNGTRIKTLLPLRGMQLTSLNCGTTQVNDLSPLQGMPLKTLSFYNTKVSDVSVLAGMPLTSLDFYASGVFDLSPLIDCPQLTKLIVTNTRISPAAVAALQQALPNCKIEWDDPAKATPQPAASGTK
jgi:Leucine-rich repeat (LRR) protein